MKIKELFETKQEINIKITNNDLDSNGRLLKQYEDIAGSFVCSDTKIASLEGAPHSVGKNFDCYNTNITSLEGAPQKVGGAFYCQNTKITSLEGAPHSVGKTFDCSYTKITSLEGAPQSVGGNFNCYNTDIISLEGAPQKIGGGFFCYKTKITSLEGAPKLVGGNFSCYNTDITSLKGIGKDFLLELNSTIDLNDCEQLSSGFLSLLRVKGLKSIKFNLNEEVQDIFNRHLSGDRDLLDCKEELMNSGFREYAKL